MADDPNKSNRPVNGMSPAELEAGSIVERYEQVRNTSTVESESIRQHGRRARVAEREAIKEANFQKVNGAPIEDIIGATIDVGSAKQRRMDIQERFQEAGIRSGLAAQNTLISKTSTFLGEARSKSRVNELQGSSEMLESAARQAGGVGSYFEQEKIRSEAQEQKHILGRKLTSIAEADRFDPKAYKATAGQIAEQESRETLASKTIGILKKGGDDPSSQLDTVQKYLQRAEKEENISEGIQKAGTEGFSLKEIGQQKSELVKSLKEMSDAFKNSTKTLEEFTKESAETTSALDKLNDIEAGVQQAGGGMGWGDVGKVAELGGRAISHVARSARVMAVDQQREQMGYKAQYAGTANRIFDRSQEAIMGGNMDALLELTGGSLKFAEDEASFAKAFTNATAGTEIVGNTIAGTGRTIQAGYEGGKAALGVGAAVASTAQGAIELSNVAVETGAYVRGNTQSAQQLATYGTGLELAKQLRKMDSTMMQGVYNQGMGAYNAVAGLGDAAGMQAQLMDPGALKGLAGAGITGIRGTQLAAMMGAAGSTSAADNMNVIESAGRAKQRGIMGQEQYVGLASQLMGAGGGAGDLEDAIAAGFDNSKLASEMVAGTLELSASMRGFGISGATSTQDMLSKTAQNLEKAGVDPNLAIGAAMSSLKNISGLMGDKSLNLGNVIERGGLRNLGGKWGNANAAQMDIAQGLEMKDYALLMAGANATGNTDEDKKARATARNFIKDKGLGDVLTTGANGQADPAELKKMMILSLTGVLANLSALGQKGVDIPTLIDRAMVGKSTAKETAILANAPNGGIRIETIGQAGRGDYVGADESKSEKINNVTGASVGVTQAEMQLKILTDAMAKSNTDLQGIFKGLADQMEGLKDQISPKEIGQMAADSAKTMSDASGAFLEGAKQFNGGIGKLFKDWTSQALKDAGENKPKVDPALPEAQAASAHKGMVGVAKRGQGRGM